MIRFLHTYGHDYTHAQVKASPLAPVIEQRDYDRLFRDRFAPQATHVFTDMERLGFWDLELAAALYLRMKNAGLRVLNNPALFKNRAALLRALHDSGLNDFNAYSVPEIADIRRYPVFLRRQQDHRAPLTDLLANRSEAEAAVAAAIASGIPEQNLVLIEQLAEPVRPGLFRKLAAFRIGDQIVPHISVHDRTWLVKYGHKFDNIEDLYQEEHGFLQTNPFASHLMKAFQLAGIEYGRADFGHFGGRLQIFEINTNPHVATDTDHPSATRIASMTLAWEKYHEALHHLDQPTGQPVRISDQKWRLSRTWRNLFARGRKLP
jgi:hypothetical protein